MDSLQCGFFPRRFFDPDPDTDCDADWDFRRQAIQQRSTNNWYELHSLRSILLATAAYSLWPTASYPPIGIILIPKGFHIIAKDCRSAAILVLLHKKYEP